MTVHVEGQAELRAERGGTQVALEWGGVVWLRGGVALERGGVMWLRGGVVWLRLVLVAVHVEGQAELRAERGGTQVALERLLNVERLDV